MNGFARTLKFTDRSFPIYEIYGGEHGITVRQYTYFDLNRTWYFRDRISWAIWGEWQRSATARLFDFDVRCTVLTTPLGPAKFVGTEIFKIGLLPE